jgi:hypothetical protein
MEDRKHYFLEHGEPKIQIVFLRVLTSLLLHLKPNSSIFSHNFVFRALKVRSIVDFFHRRQEATYICNVNAVQVTSTEDPPPSEQTAGKPAASSSHYIVLPVRQAFSVRSEETSVWLSTYRTHTVP